MAGVGAISGNNNNVLSQQMGRIDNGDDGYELVDNPIEDAAERRGIKSQNDNATANTVLGVGNKVDFFA